MDKMPLSNKCVSGGGGPGQVRLPELPAAAEGVEQPGAAAAAAAAVAGVAAARVVHSDLGDPGIVKSPSDPKSTGEPVVRATSFPPPPPPPR